ncbi:MAG: hypothetical protein WBP11_14315 [Dokdonella sp.]
MFHRSTLAGCLALLASADLHAQVTRDSQVLDRFSIWLGGYRSSNDVQLNAEDFSGTLSTGDINLSRFESTLPRIRAELLFGDYQGVAFDYYGFENKRDFKLERSFSFGGQDFAAGVQARSKLSLDVGNMAYRRWIGDEATVFGIGVGVGYYEIDISAQAEASLNGHTLNGHAAYKESAFAPLLQLGWRHAFSNQLRTYVDVSGIRKWKGPLQGHILNASIGVEWFPRQNVGIGAEYSANRIKLNADRSRYSADADIKLRGPSAYLRLRF